MRRRAVLAALIGSGLPAASQAAAKELLVSPLERLTKIDPPRPVTGLIMTGGDGATLGLDRYRGQFIVLNLWASWCFPCRDEMPGLARLADRVSGKAISVLPLAIERRGATAVTNFYKSSGISNLPVILGEGQNIAGIFAEWGLPFTVLIDGAGYETWLVKGPARWDDQAFIDWLTAEAGA